MYYTYILQSKKTGNLYIGQTNNLAGRLLKHNSNKVFSTKNRGPWELIFSKEFSTRSGAMRYEKELKNIKNNEYLIKYIADKKE